MPANAGKPSVPPKRPRPSSSSSSSSSKRPRPSLFHTLDAAPARASVAQNRAFLDAIDDDDSDDSASSALSDASSDDFEDVTILNPSAPASAPAPSGDLEITLSSAAPDAHSSWAAARDAVVGKKGPSKRERQIRILTHCMHVQFLLFHNLMRNAWVDDTHVQSILVDGLSAACKNEVARWRRHAGLADPAANESVASSKRKSPNKTPAGRHWASSSVRAEPDVPNLSAGDPLIRLLQILTFYWKKKFRITAPAIRKRGYLSASALESEIKAFQKDPHDPLRFGERVESREAFRAAATRYEGSRDVGAQLFTSLLRGLGIEARMVVSLQPAGFGWGKNEEGKVRRNASADEDSKSDSSILPSEAQEKKEKKTAEKSKGKKGKSLRGSKESPLELDSESSELSSPPPSDSEDSIVNVAPTHLQPKPTTTPKKFDTDLPFPTYWTEAISPNTHKPIAVSPMVISTVANTPELFASFEPKGKEADKARQVICYVIAYSSDGSAKDVTVRYLKRRAWPGKTKGVRIPPEKVPIYNTRGKIRHYETFDWFKSVMRPYARDVTKRTLADEWEDNGDLIPVQPAKSEKTGGEETLQGYKNSAEFVLERHLRREEALLPSAKPVKTFTTGKGDKMKKEPVYRRADVVICKTVESWHKEGRAIQPGEQPLKFVPMRAVTLVRKREIQEAERESGEKVTQGLYSRDQTDWIVPDPIVDGKIPRNVFGNIDVYVPTMVPKGAVHVPLRGTARVCKKLGIEFAEACTGFEFGKQRAVPVLTGVVVAEENEGAVRDAWAAEEEARRRKEEGKRVVAALAMWKKFLTGLRIVERVKEEYGEHGDIPDEMNPFVNRSQRLAATNVTNRNHQGDNDDDSSHDDNEEQDEVGNDFSKIEEERAGGFFLPGHEEEEVGPGGFMRNDSPDLAVGGGGFIVDENMQDQDQDHGGGGGFLVDGMYDPKAESHSAEEPSFDKPISLQSVHKNMGDVVSQHEDLDESSITETPAEARGQRRRQRGGKSGSNKSKTENTATPTRQSARTTRRRPASAKQEEQDNEVENTEGDNGELDDFADNSPESSSDSVSSSSGDSKHPKKRRGRQVPTRKATERKSQYFASQTQNNATSSKKATRRGRGKK